MTQSSTSMSSSTGTSTPFVFRYSNLDGNSINSGPVLNWLQTDSSGHKIVQLKDESAINTPAVAAAFAIKPYVAQEDGEISLEVGDLISVIDMPDPEESMWWRGKRGFEVGFFPCDCVEMIRDFKGFISSTLPRGMKQVDKLSTPLDILYPTLTPVKTSPSTGSMRHRGKLVSLFRFLVYSRGRADREASSSRNKEPVFTVDLSEYLSRSGSNCDVPLVLKWCSQMIEQCGIVDGIYRLSGVISNIEKLRKTFEVDRIPDIKDDTFVQDVHCVSSLLKLYFRELPDPLLTYNLYDDFIRCLQPNYPKEVSIASDRILPEAIKIENLKRVVHHLPPPHYRTLEYLMKHLNHVASHGPETGMTPKNLAIVWAPNLLRCKDIDSQEGVAALHLIGIQAVVTEYLIRYADKLFVPIPEPHGSGIELHHLRGDSVSPPSINGRLIRSPEVRTPRRTRLYSLESCSTPTTSSGKKLIDVGGGPHNLPPKYHTIIQSISRSKTLGSRRLKRTTSSSGPTNFSILMAGNQPISPLVHMS